MLHKKYCLISLLGITFLSMFAVLRVYCMPTLDRYTQYESNIIEMCDTGSGFLEISEAGNSLSEPKGEKNSSHFKYYQDGSFVKQVYRTDSVICIVSWSDDVHYLLYKVK